MGAKERLGLQMHCRKKQKTRKRGKKGRSEHIKSNGGRGVGKYVKCGGEKVLPLFFKRGVVFTSWGRGGPGWAIDD